MRFGKANFTVTANVVAHCYKHVAYRYKMKIMRPDYPVCDDKGRRYRVDSVRYEGGVLRSIEGHQAGQDYELIGNGHPLAEHSQSHESHATSLVGSHDARIEALKATPPNNQVKAGGKFRLRRR